MAKAEASVEELVGMIERGELRLPEMQRRYVWQSTRVRDLLDSIYRGYPSGAILVWETGEKVPLHDFAIEQQSNGFSNTRLLLDGQQRLTSLWAVIRGKPVTVRGRKRPIDLLFNLEHPDEITIVTEVNEDNGDDESLEDESDSTENELLERFNKMTFVIASKKLEQLPQWVKVTEVFQTDSDAIFLKRAGVLGFDDPKYEKYSQRLARLRGVRKYTYRMDVLDRALSYSEVTEIFVRVNSLGAKLRSSDLAMAQITAKWPGSLKVFEDFQVKCAKAGFELDLGIHLKSLITFATGQSRFLTVGTLSTEQLQNAWKESCRGMEFALNFLKENIGIDSPALLSSPFILVLLAYFGHLRKFRLADDEAERLRYWALIANAKGRYSRGSSETILDQDLTVLKQGGGPSELIERLRLQVGRLDVLPEELEGRTQKSALFKTMFMAFRAAGAKDWNSKLSIALDLSGHQHRLEFHHIFPKALLKGSFDSRQIDEIANLAFIGGATNRTIGSNPPIVYFPKLKVRDDQLLAQCIPTHGNLWKKENYEAFLAERRKLIAGRLNQFIEHG